MPPAGIEWLMKPDHVLNSHKWPVKRGLVAKLAHAASAIGCCVAMIGEYYISVIYKI